VLCYGVVVLHYTMFLLISPSQLLWFSTMRTFEMVAIQDQGASRMSDDCYGDYVKQLDGTYWLQCGMTLASTLHLMHLLPWRVIYRPSWPPWGTKVAHIVAAGGRAMAPNSEFMVLEMSIATAMAVGCSFLVCFMDSTMAMLDLVDPTPHSSQNSSLAACSAL